MRKVSESTVERLSLYLRLLEEFESAGRETISSAELAERAGTTSAQVRKDLSAFGTFGKRGLGYHVSELVVELRSILGLGRRWRVALIGAGRIGSALYGYQDFKRQGFYITAVFDADPRKVGRRLGDLVIRSDSELSDALRDEGIDIVITAVPADAAQGVVDRVVSAGIRAILNFAPTQLQVPDHVELKNVNMAMEMEGLSYALVRDDRFRQPAGRS